VSRDYDAAEAMYVRALKKDPNSTATLCNYGLLMQTVRAQFMEAQSLYQRSLAVDPGHVATLCNFAYLSATVQDYRESHAPLYCVSSCRMPIATASSIGAIHSWLDPMACV
jgi:tetratricopeptide (TPR) repeat protein